MVSPGPGHSSWRMTRWIHHRQETAPSIEIEEKDGNKIANPDYEDCVAGDQQVLNYLLASMTKETLVRIATAKTAAEAWNTLEQ
jgi:hypothetical protein